VSINEFGQTRRKDDYIEERDNSAMNEPLLSSIRAPFGMRQPYPDEPNSWAINHDLKDVPTVQVNDFGQARDIAIALNMTYKVAYLEGSKALRAEAEGMRKGLERFTGLPRIITLCGSTRFTAQMLDEAWRLTLLGNIVIHWNILNSEEAFAHGAEREGGDVKELIDALYLHKVRMADEVRVINVGGYIGDSTAREVAHAMKWDKEITWLEPESTTDSMRKLEAARLLLRGSDKERK
jgi:hypothetical protein